MESEAEQERRECWDLATYMVSLVVRPDHEGLERSAALADEAAVVAADHPELARQLVTAIAVFASELPVDAVREALDRLADDERGSKG